MYLYRIKCLDEKCLYGFAIAVMEAIGSRNSWSGIFRSSDWNFVAYARGCDIDKGLPCRPRWAPLRLSSWEGRVVPEVVTWEGARRIHWEKWATRQVRCFHRRSVVSDADSTIDSIFVLPCVTKNIRNLILLLCIIYF